MSGKEIFCIGSGNAVFINLLNESWKTLDGSSDSKGLKSLCDDKIKALWQGGKWKGIWSQNYMGMHCWTPFLDGRLLTCHDNACNYFFDLQGDGETADKAGAVAPKGALPEHVFFGDGKTPLPHYKNDEHTGKSSEYDFWVEGTCGNVICKTDILLVTRNLDEINKYIDRIELAMNWIESLRDSNTGLIKTGPAGTFIERAYSGTDLGNGKFSFGFPSGVMAHNIKALQNLIEIEKLAKRFEKANFYSEKLKASLESLPMLLENDSYFVNYMDSKGVKHGILGAEKHSYFESNPNHDAVAYGVVSPQVSEKIFETILSIPELRKNKLIPCVHPSRDDVLPGYQDDPAYGPGPGYHWHGAAWFSSQARMLTACMKMDMFEYAEDLLGKMLEIYKSGSMRDVMDNFGAEFPGSYNPEEKNVAYIDGFGVFGAALRGLFEYEYRADSLIIRPHFPGDVTEFCQKMPVRFGEKKIFPRFVSRGKAGIAEVKINGESIDSFDESSVFLEYESLPENSEIEVFK
jgi:hypothetical protein